ncbi:MAG: phosphatase PAP2 family protein [Myxococcota bacterium]
MELARAKRAAALAAGLLLSASASAQSFDESWRQADALDAVLTTVGFSAALTISLGADTPRAFWNGEGPVDELMLHLGSEDATRRIRAGRTSDVLGLLTLVPSLLTDPILGYTSERTLGRELGIVSLRSYALTALIVATTKYGIRRHRPSCGANCSPGDHRSFISGHSAFVWTAASLTCVAHRHVDLFNSQAARIASCASVVGLATTTSVLRMVARRHYFTDVLVGALVGLLSGWVLPAVATYGFGG